MALIINSRDLYDILHGRGEQRFDRNQMLWAYNALDSAVTLGVHESLSETLRKQNTPHARTSYSFVRAMQGPAMDMMLRGVAIQQGVRQDETARYLGIRNKAQAILDRLADAVWGPAVYIERIKTREEYTPLSERTGKPLKSRTRVLVEEVPYERPRGLNPGSPKQVLAFFNGALRLPVEYEVRKTPEGSVRTPTANDKALAKWAKRTWKGPGIDVRDRSGPPVRFAAPIVSLILTIRDADKMLGVLRTPLDPDGRMRCSYNVVGTESGRWSSSKNAFGRGTNLQNITPTMRRMFCADDGWRLASTDLEQAESWIVAGLVWACTGDNTYWRAIASGDLHTQVARMVWPELPWTGDLKKDRDIANEQCKDLPNSGVQFTYRDVAKRLGHGSNYDGSAYGIAQAVGIPVHVVEDFQRMYFRAFPHLREWHRWVRVQLLEHQYLDTPLGRRRWFFGRPNEDSTAREAIAFAPQSVVAELLNLIMHRTWTRSLLPPDDPLKLPIQLLLQNHDAFLFQFPENLDPAKVISSVNEEFSQVPIPFAWAGEHRTITIPGEFVIGWNWAYKDNGPRDHWKFEDGNPDGLDKWRGAETRTRVQTARTSAADWVGRPVARF